ncbi:patatin-like phospholipase family protein [Candidatus Omnitrophota bacterium]
MQLFKRKKIALALGGGSARGFANIGVLKVLEREKIPVDFVVGSSIGALTAALYSLGMPASVMEEAALKFSWDKLVDLGISRTAMLKGKKLEALVGELIGGKGFSDTKIPIAITTTDIETGEELTYTKGNLQKLVQASCSWPGIFPPVEIEGRKLTDGGIRSSIPVKMIKKLGEYKVIAVHIGFCVKKGKLDNLFQMFVQSVQILGQELDRYQSMQADVVIEPELHEIDQFAFDKAKQAIRDGEDATEKVLSAIKKLVGKTR